jgi:ABC-2 type transport system ATP-binding protein
MDDVVAVDALVRRYGAVIALRSVSFGIRRGEVVGLLGPNGAGKSTVMKILTGWLAPTSGTAKVCGHDTLEDPVEAQRRLGYLPENAPLYPEMSVRGLLRFVADVRGLGASERERGIERVADECGLTDRLGQTIGALSKGYRQRVGLAAAILHEPALLVLDEPTTGLDPNQIAEVRALIRRLGKTRTVILSTHILPEVEATCDRVLILHRGQVVADGPTAAITGGSSGHRVTVALGHGKVTVRHEDVRTQLGAITGVRAVSMAAGDAAHRFLVDADHDVRADVFRWAVEHGHVLVELSPERRDLEEVFRSLTQDAT